MCKFRRENPHFTDPKMFEEKNENTTTSCQYENEEFAKHSATKNKFRTLFKFF